MTFFTSIWAMLQRVGAAIAAAFFYNLGKEAEKKKAAKAEIDALKDEIERLNSLPRNDTDRLKLWERKIREAKAREKGEQ